MATQFFVRRGEKVVGPVTDGQLRQTVSAGRVRVTDQVGKSRDGPWSVVGKVPALASLSPKPPAAPRGVLQRNEFLVQRLASFSRWSRKFRSHDILDPESKQVILECRDQVSVGTKLRRRLMFSNWHEMPLDIVVRKPTGEQILRLRHEGLTCFTMLGKRLKRLVNNDPWYTDLDSTQVLDKDDRLIGTLARGLDAIRGADGQVVCHLESEFDEQVDEVTGSFGITIGPVIIGLFPPRIRMGRADSRGGWDFSVMSPGKPLAIGNLELPTSGDERFARIIKRWRAAEIVTGAGHYDLQIEDTVPTGSPLRPLIVAAALYTDLVIRVRTSTSSGP